jgi:hypothetical protein
MLRHIQTALGEVQAALENAKSLADETHRSDQLTVAHRNSGARYLAPDRRICERLTRCAYYDGCLTPKISALSEIALFAALRICLERN